MSKAPRSNDGSNGDEVRKRIATWLGMRADAVAPAIGDRLGRFTLKGKIGKGGMGHVFLARDEDTGDSVALKVVSRTDRSRVAALQNEARRLPRAQHPNIVAFVSSGSDSRWTWIAMSLVTGTTLAEVMVGGAAEMVPLRTLITWFRDLARALHVLHEAGLLHRDVKPGNIVVDFQGKPVLIDFGLAVEMSDGQEVARLAGTIPYMSPEQTQAGFSALTRRSDIYSLAITFHEAITGRGPSRFVGMGDLLQQVAFTAVPPPSTLDADVPAGIDPIFARALAKHPGDRYRTAGELAEDLDSWLQDRPLLHAVERWRTQVWRFARHHPVFSALAAVLTVGLGFFVLVDALLSAAEHRDAQSQVRASLDAGNLDQALEVALTLRDSHPGDQVDRALHELAVQSAAHVHAEQMIQSMTFSPDWAYDRSRYRERVAIAERHFARCHHPDLLFQIVLGRFLEGRLVDGLAILDEHPVPAGPSAQLLRELRALLLLEAGRLEDFARLNNETLAAAAADDTVVCFRAYRLERARALASEEVAVRDLLDPSSLEYARRDLEAVVVRRPGFLLARTMRAFQRLEGGDAAGALVDLEALDLRTDSLDRAAVLTWRARAEVEQEHEPGSAAWCGAWDRAVSYLEQASHCDSKFVSWFADTVSYRSPEHRVEWMLRLFGTEWPEPPALDLRSWRDLAAAVNHLAETGRWGKVVELMHLVRAARMRPNSVKDTAAIDKAKLFLICALLELSPKEFDTAPADAGEVSRLDELLALVAARRTAGNLCWDSEHAEAMALARLARLKADTAECGALKTRAMSSLDNVLAEKRVERQRQVLSRQPLSEDERKRWLDTFDDCVIRLRKVRESLESLETRWR